MFKALGYFWELIKGTLITARHFVVNMVFHTLNFVGIRTKRRGAVTIQYPERKKELAARHRSLHRLMKREDGKPRCVACMLCATICPSQCIYIAGEVTPEGRSRPATFELDLARCIFCGMCEEVCPVAAIVMTRQYELATYDKSDFFLTKEKLIANQVNAHKELCARTEGAAPAAVRPVSADGER